MKGSSSGGYSDATEMTRKKAQKTTKKTTHVKKITHKKWLTTQIDAYLKDYCHDAKKEYLDEENFKRSKRRRPFFDGGKSQRE